LKSPDDIWQRENADKGVEFAKNIELIDFTNADRRLLRSGHSICTDLIGSLLAAGEPDKAKWQLQPVVKVPDEYRECMTFPYRCCNPYKFDNPPIFTFQKMVAVGGTH
jgi:hypothetical protein